MDLQNRLSTGVPGLDTILKGGLVRNDTHLIYGPPGTGKTVLCHQICFNLIRTRQMRCVYLNLLTESPHEIISHLEPFSFYDKGAVPESLYYLMAEGQIKKSGIISLVNLIGDTIQHRKADMFIFEGIENALFQSPEKIDFIEFVSQLRALTRINSCTTILTIKQSEPNPALTVVDSIVELNDLSKGPRSFKQITVHKTRGSAFLSGMHAVDLTGDGLQVYPRLETLPVPVEKMERKERRRMAMGIPELDSLMDGGIFTGSNLAVLGMPGTGKTTLGLSFLIEGARKGQRGVYMGFLETPEQLLRKTDNLDMPLRNYVENGTIQLLWQPPQGLILDAAAQKLLQALESQGEGEKRVFIDGIESFDMAMLYEERFPLFFSALLDHLNCCNATLVVSKVIPLFSDLVNAKTEFVEQLSESVILLRYLRSSEHVCKFLSVVKMRESWYRSDTKSFHIGKGGFSICELEEETRDVMRRLRIQY